MSETFDGSVPEYYESHLVPVIFAPRADELVARVPIAEGASVLEIACGTGVVTRRLLERMPASARLVATDVNAEMLEEARKRVPADPRLAWRVADAMDLPFASGGFDAVVCQFGVMFFPDKLAGMRSIRRVLRPGGTFAFNVMDSFEKNRFGRISHEAIGSFFERDAPQFYLKPFSWPDPATIEATLREAGFGEVAIESREGELRAARTHDFAVGLVRGNPAAHAIAGQGIDFERVIDAVADRLRPDYGDAPMSGPIYTIVVTATA